MAERGWTTFGAVTNNHDCLRRPVRTSDRINGPYPYYGASGVIDYIDGYTHEGSFLLISEDGENLRSRSTPIAFMTTGKVWVNNHAHVVTGNETSDTRFLKYLLADIDLSGYLTGSAQPKLSKSAMESIAINVPAVAEQRAIAEVLGALDGKIAANTALTAVIDDLAEQKFLAITVSDNAYRPLSSLAQFVNGKAYTKDATGTGRVVIRIAELNSGLGNSTVYNDLEVAEQYLARPGDLLFAWSGSLTLHRWFRNEGIVNQHIFKVIPSDVPLWVVNGALRGKLAEFKGIAADKATTMGHIQRHHLDELVLIPSAEVIDREDVGMQALWARALQGERESLMLTELRDTLLPELLSGRLPVTDAERLIDGEV